jgi:hypothetical protein
MRRDLSGHQPGVSGGAGASLTFSPAA